MLCSPAGGLLMLIGAAQLPAQSPPALRELRGALPRDALMEQLVMTADGARTYFRSPAGEIRVYDRARGTTTVLVPESAWDLSLASTRDALAYTKAGAQPGEQHVWVLPLDARTGLAAGPERRLGSRAGDSPSISPDGKSVAFARDDTTGVGQSLVVVPIAGGAERVIAEALPSSLANIRWTPDGEALYFGVNPPVECIPEWSCLPLAQPYRRPPGTIRRVAATGGPATVVATATGFWPGLSPDGTTLAWIDTGSVRRWVVADANGRQRGTFVLEQNQAAFGWLRGSTALIASTGQIRRLRSFEISGQQQRLLLETGDPVFEPAWSPDGTRVSLVTRPGGTAELRIFDADGTARDVLPLPDRFVFGSAWSPDLRWITWTAYAEDASQHVSAVELATRRVVSLYVSAAQAQLAVRWLADSRGVLLSEVRGASDDSRHALFRRAMLDGSMTVLRDMTLAAPWSAALPIDERRALLVRDPPREYRTIELTGDSTSRTILGEQPGFTSVPALSGDGAWLAVRRNPRAPDNAQMDVIELLRTDGTARATIRLPFFAAPGNALTIAPGGRDLIVAENRRPEGDPGLYVVTTATQEVRRLMTWSWRAGPPPEVAVSPDGRTVLALGWETPPTSVFTLDLLSPRSPGDPRPLSSKPTDRW